MVVEGRASSPRLERGQDGARGRGFTAEVDPPIDERKKSQVQIFDVINIEWARQPSKARGRAARLGQPRVRASSIGGRARDIEVRRVEDDMWSCTSTRCRDAMGANLVNSIARRWATASPSSAFGQARAQDPLQPVRTAAACACVPECR